MIPDHDDFWFSSLSYWVVQLMGYVCVYSPPIRRMATHKQPLSLLANREG